MTSPDHAHRVDMTDGVAASPRGRAEGREVVLPAYASGRLRHRGSVERPPDVPREPTEKGRGHGRRVQEVAVALQAGRPASVESLRRGAGGENADVPRQRRVEGRHRGLRGDGARALHAGDLAEGVHARVGPARTDDADLAAGERAQRLDDQALHGGRAGLDLPAVVRRAVVGQQECEAGGRRAGVDRLPARCRAAEQLRDLHGVGGRALAELIAHDPEVQAAFGWTGPRGSAHTQSSWPSTVTGIG